MKDCDLKSSNSRCKKLGMSCPACESTKNWFNDELKTCEVNEACRRSSIFGNSYYKITHEQLKLLEQGKVLYDIDEYGIFIILEEEEE